MNKFEQVATEYANGHYKGADYGSSIRVLMRSPDSVLFVGYGVHYTPRASKGQNQLRKVMDRATVAGLSAPYARTLIDAKFGEGATDAAIMAVKKRGMGTILVDGGGEPLPLPRALAKVIFQAEYDVVTPSCEKLVVGDRKCRQCNGNLKLATAMHHFGSSPVEDQPRTVEECQRLSNYPVISVSGYGAEKPREWWPFISWFETWDGESYVDPDFCTKLCAEKYGRRAAQELPPLEPGIDPVPLPRKPHESIRHYEEEVRWMVGADGKKYQF
jgi:hypothetical protein